VVRSFNVVVIGGGIVGMATARALVKGSRLSLVVLEAEERLAAHQTGNNSGVIHSGLYYRPGSLKAHNCVRGRLALERLCQDRGVPFERCGKIVVATSEAQRGLLTQLEERGRANGLEQLHRLDSEQIREHEPHCRGVAGLHVGETGIVDYVRVTEVYAEDLLAMGGEVSTGSRVTGISRQANQLVVETSTGTFSCRHLINCGGLQSDRIARLAGVVPEVRIVPFRGEYYELVPERRHLVRNLIYPVPDPGFPFLGVHFTRLINGGVEAGPNAVLALKREGYRRTSFSLRDAASTLTYGGFWRLARRYLRTGLAEQWRSLSKRAFVRSLQELVPEVVSGDLRRAGAGVRAQALDRSGSLVDDFRIIEDERSIHVLNAPSPAATASLAIADTIAELAIKHFDL
jgi:L-2-hydroxyglutarate oxidase